MPAAAPVETEEEVVEHEVEELRPLTPPPQIAREKKEDSPHRIPSFEFKFGALDLGGDVEEIAKEAEKVATPVKVSPPAVTVTRPSHIETRTRPVSSSSPIAKVATKPISGDLGSSSPPQASGSTNTRVRQRISREMIRETIQQRMADGTLSRHASSASGHILDAEIPKRRPTSVAIGTGIGKDKDLPPPPPMTPNLGNGVPMAKAHTTDAPATRRASQPSRPVMMTRSKTQSAEEVIQSNVKDDGFIKEPKSALDRLMDGMNSVALSTSPDRVRAVFAKPISILQKPKDSTLIPPAPDHLSAPISPSRATASASPSPSASGSTSSTKAVVVVPTPTKGKERAVSGKEKEKERAVSGKKEKKDKEGKPRRKSRRSMSTGDVAEEGTPMKVIRHSAQPRLTLGFNDAESMLDAFKDETDRIGSEVSRHRRFDRTELMIASIQDQGEEGGFKV
jgi:serine/arginine repetitive matrix protein 2